MAEVKGQTEICGAVTSVIYQNEDNGYTVLRLEADDGNIVTVVGCLPYAAPGESMELTGTWTTHPSHGAQFKAEHARRHLPETSAAIFEYLAFGDIKGVGPVTARQIVDKFGAASFEIMEEQPQRLTEIRGITPKKAEEIGRAFSRRAGLRRLTEFLSEAGLKALYAVRLYGVFGDDALAAVRDNPYILASEAVGAEFREADALALNLGFEADSSERIQAAAIYELTHNLDNGHTFIPRNKLTAVTAALIEVSTESASDALDQLIEQGLVAEETIAGVAACYLASIYEAECTCARRILDMASDDSQDSTRASLIEEAQREVGVILADEQKLAVETAARRRVMVLTGGPGTGKTTTVRAILALFRKLGLRTALTAPTGRAAKRMSELTGDEAQTIHRMLGAGWSEEAGLPVFQKCAEDPLDADAVIVDECSMVDIILMSALLNAMKDSSRLVLVGDADQLPSVGPGNVFSDIIRSGAVETVQLTEIFRQAAESRIVSNAHRINRGEMPETDNRGDFFFLQRRTPEKTVETVLELCAKRLPVNMGIDPSQIQVLSPTRLYDSGTVRLNTLLQAALNPPADGKNEKKFGEFLFREGDRVMQIRNNYDILWRKGSQIGSGVFNGDVGQLLSIDNQAQTVTIDFDERIAVYTFDMLTEFEPAYAMTVHKSQGSEYRAVVLVLSQGAQSLMTRSVLYTAVTRARELLIVVGDSDVLFRMTQDNRKQTRYSGLRARLAAGER